MIKLLLTIARLPNFREGRHDFATTVPVITSRPTVFFSGMHRQASIQTIRKHFIIISSLICLACMPIGLQDKICDDNKCLQKKRYLDYRTI